MFQFIQSRKQKGRFFALDHASELLQSQAKRLDALIRARLWLQVIIGLVMGIIVGGLLGPDLGWVSPETAVLFLFGLSGGGGLCAMGRDMGKRRIWV